MVTSSQSVLAAKLSAVRLSICCVRHCAIDRALWKKPPMKMPATPTTAVMMTEHEGILAASIRPGADRALGDGDLEAPAQHGL